jgi:hypothetical protein
LSARSSPALRTTGAELSRKKRASVASADVSVHDAEERATEICQMPTYVGRA